MFKDLVIGDIISHLSCKGLETCKLISADKNSFTFKILKSGHPRRIGMLRMVTPNYNHAFVYKKL